MDFSQLKLFVKVVQTGSFTKAAELLGTQKSYVSRVISQLEQQQGVRLLDRTTRSLSPTEIGRELFLRANRILDSVEETEAFLQQKKQYPQGTLKLTCGVELGLIAVGTWINDFLAQYPDVLIEADFTNRVVDIVHEGFDVAIRVGQLKDSSLVAKQLGHLTYKLYASPSWVAQHQLIVHPQSIIPYHVCLFNGGSAKQLWEFEHRDTAEKVTIESKSARLQLNNSFGIREAILDGLGIGVLPTIVTARAEQQGHLQVLCEDWILPTVPVYAVFPSSRYLTPKVRAFIELIQHRRDL